ncbi:MULTISPECIES: hemagglutinin repeat-containing protein [unclassified Herbaspirillum]|uniref:two-partner secretion domain-containing protein n=1 Tax=unclassified Herbaspirillum TaxID=2624150 RepID=UPI00116F3284|nr:MULTISPECIES: hemagglutinin repeat-containing protein [unclassified Herbaspirillum]TQK06365.1 filamentous hemagglutinin [Herbaspirillum sp. SJZ130]TQK12157.1 filamentous hemagglutinin [Herbaspirillum sp. SJZ106]
MNSQRYKVVFNRRRGQFMAVAENASTISGTSSTHSANPAGVAAELPRALRFSLLAVALAMSLNTVVAHAQIYSDRNAPRNQQPTVLSSGNGVPVVNIQTPSSAGVSVNAYRQFDVNANGAILNNSRGAVQTQLGGYVQGNPWLATGTARVIVNQVNSANPSYLRGYVEVAGDRAQVVIANPAGITCSGCGFINANRATLTTGTPVISGGSLEAYRVAGGVVTVDGAGLDASGSDYADIIARAVRINAGVWAQDLKVSAGLNTVSAGHDQVTPGVPPGDAAPAVAIDVAQLGGMYARHIYLASTEHGVGVRNQGIIGAAAGDAVVTADGRLENSGALTATQALTMQTTGAIANTGGMGANGAVALTAGALDNRGSINSAQGSLSFASDGPAINRGRIEAAQTVSLAAGGIDNNGGAIGAANIALDSRRQAFSNVRGNIVAQDGLTVSSGNLNNDAGLLQALGNIAIDANGQTVANTNSGATQGIIAQGALTMTAGAVVNQGGYLGAGGNLAIAAATVDNSAGVIGASALATLDATDITNAGGKIQAKGGLSINAAGGTADNSGGLLRSDGAVTVQAATLRNDNTQGQEQGIEGTTIALNAQDVSNRQGAMRADAALTLEARGRIDNTAGLLSSSGQLAITDMQATQAMRTLAVDNAGGTIVAARQLDIAARALAGNGKVLSQKDLNIALTDSIVNTGQIAASGDAIVSTAGTFANAGAVAAGGKLALTAATIDNQAAGSLVASTLNLKATDVHTFTNRGLIDGGTTVIESSTVNNIGTGRIYGDNVAIGADVLNNVAETVGGVTTAAVIAARNRLDIGAGVINNSEHALIYSAGDMVIGGALDASKKAIGMAREINNSSATINADGNLTIAANTINNTNAHLETTDQVGPGNRIITYRLNGSSNLIDGNSARLVNLGSGQVVGPYNWRDMGDEDNFRLILPSDAYPVERYGPPFTYSKGVKYGDNAIAPAYVPDWQEGSNGGESTITYHPAIINYESSDRIWTVMGVTPPVDPGAGPGGPPQPGEMCYDSCVSIPVDPAEYAAWQSAYAAWKPRYDAYIATLQVLNDKIDAFNNNVRSRSAREWTIYDGTEQITRTVVTKSDPGMITSGGNMTLAAGAVNNYASQIIAGGTVAGDSVNGTAINNTGPLGVQSVTSTGSASYTYIKSHTFSADDRRYDDAPYQSQTIVTNFQLDITPTSGAGPNRNNTVKAVAAAVSGASGQSAAAISIRTANLNLALPNNALYRIDTAPGNRYLVETDPQFTNYRSWLSSDFMLNQLQSTPDSTIKKLGDGFYEQQLVQQQIQQAIGQRYLAGYTSNEAQYMALMNAGVQQAQAFNYTVGVALSDAQIAQLTADIVWMVKQTVTLADGSTQEVLVPQVYLRASNVQVTGQGTLIAGNDVAFQTAQDIVNSGGTIAARQTVSLAADNIQNLGGRISGTNAVLSAATDINNLGGAIDGSDRVVLAANGDININSTRVETANAVTTGANISQVASVTGKDLTIAAGRDLVANAAVIGATGDVALSAGRDVNLGTVNQGYRQEINWASDSGASNWIGALTGPNFVDQSNGAHGTTESGVNRATLSASQDVATQITGNNVTINAGRDLNAQGTQVVAEAALAAAAGRDINISTANESASARDQHQHSSSGILSGSTIQTDDASSYSNQIGSTFSGNTTVLAAGRDANITGSDVVSTQGTQVTAGNDINIVAATDTSSESHYRKETTSGVFSGGGLGVTVGSKMQSSNFAHNSSTESASTVGATDGNVVLVAGNRYSQIASNVIAPQGDVGIVGKQVDILAGINTEQNIQETLFKQQGVTVQVTNPVISAIQSVMSLQESKGKTKNGRAKMLADAATALTLANAAAQVSGSAAPAGGIDLAISLGSSSNQSKTVQSSTTTAASTVASGGTTTIAATGAGMDSNLTIVGSEVTGTNINLIADNQINLLAQRNTNEEHSTNKGSSASVGVSIGTSGVMFNASASGSRGKGDGSDSDYSNTHITANNQLTMASGGDMTLKGAVAAGNQVIANVGGNLNIESLQDTSNYKSQQQSLGGSVSVGLGGGFSGSISASQSKVDGNYQSVIEQSAINAGDGGFQVNVAGNTDLKGAKIASTDKAVEEGRNQFQTASLTMSDIQNKSEYKAESQSVSAGGGYGGGNIALNGVGVGWANESGSEASMTKSGVSGIAGDATVRSDKDSSNTLVKKWDGQQLQEDVEAQAKITQELVKQAWTATISRVIKSATADKKILLQKCDSGGQNCQNTQVDLDDIKTVDGKLYVYNHGIMNTEEQALENAAKQSSDVANAQGVYVIINPYTGNPVAEVLYAGWDKLNEVLGAALPVSNSSEANIDIREQVKAQGGVVIEVDHSRGSLTSSNALAEQLNRGGVDVAIGSVTFNGAAANAERMANLVDQATGGQGVVYQSTHKNDPVGTMIGGNEATGGNTTSFPDSHGAYTGYLPPERLTNGDVNPIRLRIDEIWGKGKISTPILVSPTPNM